MARRGPKREEQWAEIEGFSQYQISNFGVVRRKLLRNRFRILKSHLHSAGYLVAALFKNKKKYSRYCHRLVAESFIVNPLNKNQVNHIDGNKKNNASSNLEWVSAKENTHHAIKIGTRRTHSFHNLSKEELVEIVNSKDSSRKAALEYNVSKTTILNIRNGKLRHEEHACLDLERS